MGCRGRPAFGISGCREKTPVRREGSAISLSDPRIYQEPNVCVQKLAPEISIRIQAEVDFGLTNENPQI